MISTVIFDAFAALLEVNYVKNGSYPDIPILLGSTANDICTPPDATVPMEESVLHNGCVNRCRHQCELGYKPSYVYYFKRRLPGNSSGAFHSSELWYMFGTLERYRLPFTAEDKALSERTRLGGMEAVDP